MSDSTLSPQLTDILKGVSRSFYLTLRVLPKPIATQIALAYLLARAADTLADTTVLPPEQRKQILLQFQQQLQHDNAQVIQQIQRQLQNNLNNPDEARLLQQLPQLFTLLHQCSTTDQTLIRNVCLTLSSGMLFDLNTFPLEESGQIGILSDQAALEHYTYLVAGCVGEFWTDISMQHLPALHHWQREHYVKLGTRFGKALQLVNILRDLPRDLRLGRCYLPQSWLNQHQLTITTLSQAQNSPLTHDLRQQGITLAVQHFAAAEQYLFAIPRHCIRLRLASLWPLLIGLATLQQLSQTEHWLDASQPCKVKRSWIYRMLALSLLVVCSNGLIKKWVMRLKPDTTK